jgi:hypothetical protein
LIALLISAPDVRLGDIRRAALVGLDNSAAAAGDLVLRSVNAIIPRVR